MIDNTLLHDFDYVQSKYNNSPVSKIMFEMLLSSELFSKDFNLYELVESYGIKPIINYITGLKNSSIDIDHVSLIYLNNLIREIEELYPIEDYPEKWL